MRHSLQKPWLHPAQGTARVVGLQDLLLEQEEITQPSLTQSARNRHAAVPFIKRPALNVRMSHVVIASRQV